MHPGCGTCRLTVLALPPVPELCAWTPGSPSLPASRARPIPPPRFGRVPICAPRALSRHSSGHQAVSLPVGPTCHTPIPANPETTRPQLLCLNASQQAPQGPVPASGLHAVPTSSCSRTDKGSAAQSCLTLCDPMDHSPPGSSVHGILQARILEWVAASFSRASSRPRDRTWVSCTTGRLFTL